MPPAGTGLFSLRGRARTFRRSCGFPAEGERSPQSGDGRFSPREGGCFLPPSAAGSAHAAACGECAAFGGGRTAAGRQPGFAKGGTGHPDLRPGFLYPLLRLPLTFRSAATPFGRAAKARGTQLRPLYHRNLLAAVWGWLAVPAARSISAHNSARQRGERL